MKDEEEEAEKDAEVEVEVEEDEEEMREEDEELTERHRPRVFQKVTSIAFVYTNATVRSPTGTSSMSSKNPHKEHTPKPAYSWNARTNNGGEQDGTGLNHLLQCFRMYGQASCPCVE